MKAGKFFLKDKYELISILDECKDIGYYSNEEEEKEIEQFFEDSKELDYNDFLKLYNEKYGNIINQYRESKRIKLLNSIYNSNNPNGEDRELFRKTFKIVYVLAIIYLITTGLAVIGALYFLNIID